MQKYASLDYAPLYTDPDAAVLMLTLTYPRDWETYAPDPPTVQKHLTRWRYRLARSLQAAQLLPYVRLFTWMAAVSAGSTRKATLPREYSAPPTCWKLEYQARGAPHVHLLLALPAVMPYAAKTGWEWLDRQAWCGRSWAAVVGCDDPEFVRHGAFIDPRYAGTDRLSDPAQVAIYLAAHSLPGERKGYQHRVPRAHQGYNFRLWGVTGLESLDARQTINPLVAKQVSRILRAHKESQRTYDASHRPRCRRVHVFFNDTATTEIYTRSVTRRLRLRSLYGSRGHTVVARNAPRLADRLIDAATYAATARVVDDPTWWHSPGESRCPEVFG